MINSKFSEITGYRGSKIPLTTLIPKNTTDHLAVIFPGSGYSCNMPLLYYATNVCLMSKRMTVIQVGTNYSGNNDWMKTTNEERKIWCKEDALALWSFVKTNAKATSYTLIGKSAGTRCIAGLIESNIEKFRQIVWYTPALENDWHLLQNTATRNLSIIGTKDHWWDAAKEYLTETDVIIEGADHSIEIIGDTLRSISFLSDITAKVDDWLET